MKELIISMTMEEYIKETLDGMSRTLSGIIATGVGIGKIKAQCKIDNPVNSGSDFKTICKGRLKMSEATATYFFKISEKSNLIISNSLYLPSSPRSLYELTTLSEDDFETGVEDGTINPNMTQADVKAYKDKLKQAIEKAKQVEATEKRKEYEKTEAFKKKQDEDKARDIEIDKCKPDALNLRQLISTLTVKKKISDADRERLEALATPENVWSRGADEVKAEIELLFKETDKVIKPPVDVDEEPRVSIYDPLEKSVGAIFDKFMDSLFFSLAQAPPSSATRFMGYIASDAVLFKKVFKVVRQHYHPDRDTGNEEIFKDLSAIEEAALK